MSDIAFILALILAYFLGGGWAVLATAIVLAIILMNQ